MGWEVNGGCSWLSSSDEDELESLVVFSAWTCSGSVMSSPRSSTYVHNVQLFHKDHKHK